MTILAQALLTLVLGDLRALALFTTRHGRSSLG
jgi:hypothetical protein